MEKCGEEARNKSVQGGMRCVFHIPRIHCAPAHPGRLHAAEEPACRGAGIRRTAGLPNTYGFLALYVHSICAWSAWNFPVVSILQDHKWHMLLFVLITTELSSSDRLFAGNGRLKTQSLVGVLWKHAPPTRVKVRCSSAHLETQQCGGWGKRDSLLASQSTWGSHRDSVSKNKEDNW